MVFAHYYTRWAQWTAASTHAAQDIEGDQWPAGLDAFVLNVGAPGTHRCGSSAMTRTARSLELFSSFDFYAAAHEALYAQSRDERTYLRLGPREEESK